MKLHSRKRCNTAFARARGACVGAVIALAGASAHAFELRTVDAGLDAAESANAARVAAHVDARLPRAWREALVEPVRIEWTGSLPADVHGRAFDRRILLRRELLREASGGESGAAVAALVHELAHILDRSPRGGWSDDERLLDLAGWQRAALKRPRDSRSTLTDRTPDRYEHASPREFVAVNLERFVLDPEYACRRPALYRHFAARLGERPHAACAPSHAFVQADARTDAPDAALLELDPARVAAVDYLLAAPDTAPMSRWGHGMLRLVVCAPGRAPGPACRLDLEHHRVLSFRAFVDDVQISSWRGLTGGYPSRLFVLPLSQVIEEYTRVELRDLKSVPLTLGRGEIASLLEHASQVHWSYDGRYRFVGNNCAVETHRLLQVGVPRIAVGGSLAITPVGLLRRLQATGLADASALQDPEAARRGAYLFESLEPHYDRLFATARTQLDLPARDARQWLSLAPTGRARWIGRADLRAAAALLVLEGAAVRRQEQLARSELKRRLLQTPGPVRETANPAGAALETLRLVDRLTRPAALLPGAGYGLPQAAEREVVAREAAALAGQWRNDSVRLQAEARLWLSPARRDALAATEANVARLGDRLRQLNRDNGGLDLSTAD